MQDEQAREVYEVWTITVRVSCGGVSRLELRGPLLQDVWISDAFVLNDDGRNVNLVPAGAIKNAHTFRLVIGTCEIEVSLSTAQLAFVAVQEREEEWVGPLIKGSRVEARDLFN